MAQFSSRKEFPLKKVLIFIAGFVSGVLAVYAGACWMLDEYDKAEQRS